MDLGWRTQEAVPSLTIALSLRLSCALLQSASQGSMCLTFSLFSLPELHTWGTEGCCWHVQEVGESTPKASAASPSSTFARRPSAAMSELEPLAEVEGEGEGGVSEDPDAPVKGTLPALTCKVPQNAKHESDTS